MHVIIDGYNMLGLRGQVGPGSEAARERLLLDLLAYRQRTGHAITVVFDGWREGHGTEHREHRAGVEVRYSKRGERADQVIQRLVMDFGRDCAVVSSDREVADFAQAQGAFTMRAAEFEPRLRGAQTGSSRHASGITGKGEDDADVPKRNPDKKGNAKKLPKALRARQRRLRGF